jgi:hypothetical protein
MLVSAWLVWCAPHDGVYYQLHVIFHLPAPVAAPVPAGEGEERRPILAIHRGLVHLYSAVVTTPDATRELAPGFAASGEALMRVQAALERARKERARRGAQPTVRDRRQRRIAKHHVAVAANQVVEQALRHGAQVVCEDLGAWCARSVTRCPRANAPRGRSCRAGSSRPCARRSTNASKVRGWRRCAWSRPPASRRPASAAAIGTRPIGTPRIGACSAARPAERPATSP